jgi:hypothetical protein
MRTALTDKDRGRICAYREEGHSFAEIGEKLDPARHKSTVRCAYELEMDAAAKKKKTRGRPASISSVARRRIVREVDRHGEKTYAEIRDDLDLDCSVSAVTKICEKAGYSQLLQPHKGSLTEAHLEARRQWCHEHHGKTVDWWENKVHFVSDGTRFKKGRDDHLSREGLKKGSRKRKKGAGLEPKNICDPRAPIYSHCYFVGMSMTGKITMCEPYASPMKLSEDKFRPIAEKMSAAIFRAHPNEQRPTAGWTMYMDNDSAQLMFEPYFNSKRIRLFRGPPNSGDLRPIETTFARIQRKLYDDDPGPGETKEAWLARVQRTVLRDWGAVLTGVLGSTPARIRDCLLNNGGRVDY